MSSVISNEHNLAMYCLSNLEGNKLTRFSRKWGRPSNVFEKIKLQSFCGWNRNTLHSIL